MHLSMVKFPAFESGLQKAPVQSLPKPTALRRVSDGAGGDVKGD